MRHNNERSGAGFRVLTFAVVISSEDGNWTDGFLSYPREKWESAGKSTGYIPLGLTFTNPTFCPHMFMCSVWISEQTEIISLYNINWLAFITETECVYCAVRTGYLKIFMRFVWISEQTAIISLYNINWLVCITETECVYCAVRAGYFKIFVCSVWISEQPLFPYTTLTGLYNRDGVFTARYGPGI